MRPHIDEKRKIVAGFAACIALVFTTGCGRSGQAALEGAVTYNGNMLADDAEGIIRLVPCDGTTGVSAVVKIAGGRYHAELPPGVYRVEILASRDSTKTDGDGKTEIVGPNGPVARKEQFIPEKYNRNSALKVTIASDSKTVTQNFAITD